MTEIELGIPRPDQLFDSLDPAPFHATALDRNVDAYLLESAGARRPREPLTIAIHAPAEIAPHLDDIAVAIHAHFTLAQQQAERRHRRRRQIGRVALTVGVLVLAAALMMRRWVEALGGALGEVLAEDLLILAWIQRRLLAILSRVPVRFVATATNAGGACGK